jgi:hypothetical protein
MADEIKMSAKHEFSIVQSFCMQINWNLRFGKKVLEKITWKTFLNFKMAVWEPKEKNSVFWRHLDLNRHLEVWEKKLVYAIFLRLSFCISQDSEDSIDLHKNLLSYGNFMHAWPFCPPFCFFAPVYFFL